ncbi:MAG: tetraacyldisaccharide 4'-kinase [Methylococcales bacterium]|nr:tetraacyldisaccharide 4'-kinase [Methylococcales bacterium]MBT7442716.1 tetraacyldisaccharide 4'-kinase [Methylococcales bacterium]
MKRIDHYWYHKNWVAWALWPLSVLFCLLVWFRRRGYRLGWITQTQFAVPVIVVGNISVGGTGKTPTVVALIEWLKKQGYRPGVISRGYCGQAEYWPQDVTEKSLAMDVGDEAILIAQRCQCPMMVGPDRVASVRALLEKYECDVVVSDDGLQHYRMGRAVEIVVLDGERRYGNGFCLPAGPLREPRKRAEKVDIVIANGMAAEGEYLMTLQPVALHQVADSQISKPVNALKGHKVHAVAGIGNPERFFKQLERLGYDVVRHAFDDHYAFSAEDLQFELDLPIVMTEKDAVKCVSFASDKHWYMSVRGQLEPALFQALEAQLKKD